MMLCFKRILLGGDALQIFYFYKEIDKQLKVFIVFLTSHILDKDLNYTKVVGSYFTEGPLPDDGGQVHHAPVVVWGAAALVQHLVISRLEQTVPDVIPGIIIIIIM